jgi:hypothetical protein
VTKNTTYQDTVEVCLARKAGSPHRHEVPSPHFCFLAETTQAISVSNSSSSDPPPPRLPDSGLSSSPPPQLSGASDLFCLSVVASVGACLAVRHDMCLQTRSPLPNPACWRHHPARLSYMGVHPSLTHHPTPSDSAGRPATVANCSLFPS